MLSCNNLSVVFGGQTLFEEISFNVNPRDRIGLVGKNGAGKTTLMRVISGKMEPEKGSIAKPSDMTVGYLPQEMQIKSNKTIFDETLTAFAEILHIEAKIQKITHQLATREDHNSEAYSKLISQLNDHNEHFAMLDGATIEAETEKILLGLGFDANDITRNINEFSNGWQMRVELAKLILQKPSLLLLDEPTNHLDIESIQWLEDFLISYPGAAMIVSHDRAFLDNVTNRTIEITYGKIYDYKANYSEFIKQRQERIVQQQAEYSNQQKQIDAVEDFIERFRYKASKSRQVQSKIKMLDKMDRIEVDSIDKSSIHFRFPEAPASGKVVIEAENAAKKYGEKQILKGLDFMMTKGEKIAFVGRNGEGKSTLVKMIMNEIDFDGKLGLGFNVSTGYFAQNQPAFLNPEKTVFESIDDIAVGDIRTRIRNILGSFLFSGETIDKKVKVLSGGEKTRLALAKLLLAPVNLLILDEPTHHLDMQSKDILKNALLQYSGTLIIVSHDRDFLQGLTSRVFEFKNQGIKEYLGDIYDFLEARKLSSLQQLEKKANQNDTSPEKSVSQNKLNYEKKKELEKEYRKIQNRIERCEKNIDVLEKQIVAKEYILHHPDEFPAQITQNSIFKEYEDLKKQLSVVMNEWETLNAEAEVFMMNNK